MRKALICVCLTVASILASPGVVSYAQQSIPSPLVQTDNSDDINHLFGQAYQAYTAEDYIGAETIYRKILELNSDSQTEALVYNSLGEVQRIQGKWNQAIKAYQNSIEADPNFFFSRVNIGITLYQMGQTEEARQSLGQAREFLPEKVESLETLGHYIFLSKGLRQIDQFPESIQIIRQAISLNPYVANGAHCQLLFEVLETSGIPVNLTLRQYRAARCELEIYLPDDQFLRKIVQKSQYAKIHKKVGLEELIIVGSHTLFEPNFPNERLDEAYSITHLNLGVSLLNRAMLIGDVKSMKEAVTSFQDSLEYESNYPWTYLYLSIALIAQELWEEAIPVAQQALQLPNAEDIYGITTSTHSWAHNILGYAYQLMGNFNAAIEEYQSAIQLDEDFTSAKNNLQEIQ